MKNFLKGVRGKQVLVSALAVLVLVAGYYRWSVEKSGVIAPVMNEMLPSDETEDLDSKIPTEDTDYFAKAKYERDCARSEAAELLKVSAQNGEIGEIAQQNQKRLAQYAVSQEKEVAIENMVKAKGYADCVAFVDEAGVRVVVKSPDLNAEGVAKIKDIVVEQTGVKATNIKISNKE